MIVVAEDNDIIIQMLREHLEGWGYTVEIATDGETAIQKVKSGDCQLVIMDIWLTGMDGVTAACFIRSMPEPKNRTPILALTGGLATTTIAAMKAAAFDEMVQKPIMPRHLKASVMRLAGAPR